jgi:hypothetical protein
LTHSSIAVCAPPPKPLDRFVSVKDAAVRLGIYRARVESIKQVSDQANDHGLVGGGAD